MRIRQEVGAVVPGFDGEPDESYHILWFAVAGSMT